MEKINLEDLQRILKSEQDSFEMLLRNDLQPNVCSLNRNHGIM